MDDTVTDGADFQLVANNGGGYTLKCVDTNKFVKIVVSGTHVNFTYADDGTTFVVNDQMHTVVTKDEISYTKDDGSTVSSKYAIGNQKKYKTISTVQEKYWSTNALAEFWIEK